MGLGGAAGSSLLLVFCACVCASAQHFHANCGWVPPRKEGDDSSEAFGRKEGDSSVLPSGNSGANYDAPTSTTTPSFMDPNLPCAATLLRRAALALSEAGVAQPFLCKGTLLRAVRHEHVSKLDDIDLCFTWWPDFDAAVLKARFRAQGFTPGYASSARFTSNWYDPPSFRDGCRCSVDVLVLYPPLLAAQRVPTKFLLPPSRTFPSQQQQQQQQQQLQEAERPGTHFLAAGPGSETATTRRYGARRFWFSDQQLVRFGVAYVFPPSWHVPSAVRLFAPRDAALHLTEAYGVDWRVEKTWMDTPETFSNLYADVPPVLPAAKRPWPMDAWTAKTNG